MSIMRLHVLEHAPFEGPAAIGAWAKKRGHAISTTRLFASEGMPPPSAFDWLVVMGGPMGANDDAAYPWMAAEKRLIAEAISGGKIVLGVCLGAQLIARVLGARVSRNAHQEIGWFPVHLTEEARSSRLFGEFPSTFTPFHWHGDTFDIPAGAKRIAWSEGCANQAFECGGRVVGLQFHLELSAEEGIGALIEHCGGEIAEGPYIQKPGDLLASKTRPSEIEEILERLLCNLEAPLG